ncbi:hypothetical protein DH2020_034567 [Rehmannia glutinosa]|uniref:Reverse transcriptase Ty1/copia-type domain-containing protein n=1 Tax=Rehmannia glutinosa TaxID=99300 RepID=A0ABR0VB95_REHGL
MTDEYLALMRNNTWALVPLSSNEHVIGCKWVFRVKKNPDGSVNKYKARLVAKGFSQIAGFDFTETFSPVVKPTTIRIILSLSATFTLRDLGQVDYFLGIQVQVTQQGVCLSQAKYIKDLLCKTKMQNAKPIHSPMTTGEKLTAYGNDRMVNVQLYRSTVGALQYVTITRPEIAFSVNKVCQFMQRPLNSHWKSVKRILRYLSGTVNHGLHFTPDKSLQFNLVGYSDADWASNCDDRRSTTGYCLFLGSNLVSWQSKKQHTVSRSSTEAEYRSVASLVAEITWVRSLLKEINVHTTKTPIVWCDNLSTVQLTANPVLHARTKHIELDLYFVREKVQQHLLEIRHVPAVDQIADIFTKANSSATFCLMRDKLKVHEP